MEADHRRTSTGSRAARTGNRAETGRAGEEAAARHLSQAGYRILARNWRCRAGEIDLIAEDGGALVFVEVRARTNPTRFGTAIEAVDARKQRQVRAVAAYYLASHSVAGRSVRCDVVAVTFGSDGTVGELRHVKNAF